MLAPRFLAAFTLLSFLPSQLHAQHAALSATSDSTWFDLGRSPLELRGPARPNVYLASAELSAVTAKLGRLPTHAEYLVHVQHIAPLSENIYRYLNFNEIAEYTEKASNGVAVPV